MSSEEDVKIWIPVTGGPCGGYLEHLRRRGLIQMPAGKRSIRGAQVKAVGSVSSLVADQRR
jgi:hypothetical protein